MINEVLKETRIEDLSGDLLLVAELCGLEVALTIWNRLKGVALYIPETALIKTIERHVIENYPAKSVKQLVVETGLTERWIYLTLRKYSPNAIFPNIEKPKKTMNEYNPFTLPK